jgi:hypothetical protein
VQSSGRALNVLCRSVSPEIIYSVDLISYVPCIWQCKHQDGLAPVHVGAQILLLGSVRIGGRQCSVADGRR